MPHLSGTNFSYQSPSQDLSFSWQVTTPLVPGPVLFVDRSQHSFFTTEEAASPCRGKVGTGGPQIKTGKQTSFLDIVRGQKYYANGNVKPIEKKPDTFIMFNNNLKKVLDFICFYRGLCLKGKPWSPIQDVGQHLTEQTRTDMSAKVCNWSRGVNFLMTVSWLSHDCLMTVSWLSHADL